MTPITRASLWMIGAIASFSAMAVAGREVSFELDTFEIMLYRSMTGIIIVVGVAGESGALGQITTRHMGLHLVRNMAHFTGQNLWFFAVATVPFAQVFALEFTTPIWAILLAPLILRERVSRMGLIVAGIGFAGILVVARPTPEAMSPGLMAAAFCAVGFALSALFTRRLTRTETITCVLFYLTVMQAAFGLICAGADLDIALPSATSVPWLLLIGCAGLMAHFCLTNALALAPAAVVMPIDFARLPVIAVIGMAFYSEDLDPLVFLGAAVIFGANYLNILSSQRAARPLDAAK